MESDEILVSFDVFSLFTNVPVDDATSVIHGRLREDETLGDRTILYLQQIAELLEMCPEVHLPAMEAMASPVSAVVANLYMEFFKELAL